MDNPKVGIVLVNYNGEKFQNDCIKTIKHQKYKNYIIIIVDNGSVDNSISLTKRDFPEAHIIEMGDNLGVAEGNNIGINYAIKNGCEYILLLNNDTELDDNLLLSLMERARKDVIVVPKMYYYKPKNLIWCAGGEINWKRATTVHYGMNKVDSLQYENERYVEYAPTCCMLIHKDVFKNVGFMDENYFMYYDDTDFCVRLRKNKFRILFYPQAILWHKVSSSSGGQTSLTSIYYGTRNRLYFIDKYYKRKFLPKSFFYITRILKLIEWSIKGKKDRILKMTKAIVDYHKKRMGIQR